MSKEIKTTIATLIALSGIIAAGVAVWWQLFAR